MSQSIVRPIVRPSPHLAEGYVKFENRYSTFPKLLGAEAANTAEKLFKKAAFVAPGEIYHEASRIEEPFARRTLRTSSNPSWPEAADVPKRVQPGQSGRLAAAVHLEAPSLFSTEKRHDKVCTLKAVCEDGNALRYAAPEFRQDREVVLAAVSQKGAVLECASEELRRDREVVLAAVRQDGMALEFADQRLRSNKEVVLAALQQKGFAIQYAGEELLGDHEVAMAAVRQDPASWGYVQEGLRLHDKQFRAAANLCELR